mmetsp:Transcript_65387/g.200222  ORF Transcript_65387/g.200222 Transcript_65387/m.200222 type:complete len:213 (+) Transcript_65387:827-1465(+)
MAPNVMVSMEKPTLLCTRQKPCMAPSPAKTFVPTPVNASMPLTHAMMRSILVFICEVSRMHFSASPCHRATSACNCLLASSCFSWTSFSRVPRRFSCLDRSSKSGALLSSIRLMSCSNFDRSFDRVASSASSVAQRFFIRRNCTALRKELAAHFFSIMSDWPPMYARPSPVMQHRAMSINTHECISEMSRTRCDTTGSCATISSIRSISCSS